MATVTSIARETGISKGYVSKLLNGVMPIASAEMLQKLIVAAGKSSIEELREQFPMIRTKDTDVANSLSVSIQINAPDTVRVQLMELKDLTAHLVAIERITGVKFTLTICT